MATPPRHLPARKNPDNRPLGERIRETVNNALEDPRRQATQLAIINDHFMHCANALPSTLEQELSRLFNMVAMTPPEDRNVAVVEFLTALPPSDGHGYTPFARFGIGYNNVFTDVSLDEIVELPGYIKLHEVARDLDVAIRVGGVFSHEIKGSGDHMPPAMLYIDPMKTYEEGAMENAAQYPTLKEKKPPQLPPGKGGRSLDL